MSGSAEVFFYFHEKWNLFRFHSVAVMRNTAADTVGILLCYSRSEIKIKVVCNVCHKQTQENSTKQGRSNSTYFAEFSEGLLAKKEVSYIETCDTIP